ncbi:MAG: PKD domain-containing protein [Bacteroidia bacterium]
MLCACTVAFTNQSTNASSYQWNFGDRATSAEANPSHVYTTDGTFTVTLKNIEDAGTEDQTTHHYRPEARNLCRSTFLEISMKLKKMETM